MKPEFDRLIKEYLEPIKKSIKESAPSERLLRQVNELTKDYNKLDKELDLAKGRIMMLIHENDQLKRK